MGGILGTIQAWFASRRAREQALEAERVREQELEALRARENALAALRYQQALAAQRAAGVVDPDLLKAARREWENRTLSVGYGAPYDDEWSDDEDEADDDGEWTDDVPTQPQFRAQPQFRYPEALKYYDTKRRREGR